MSPRVYNVLFLCTANSARSILAECILNRLGHSRFRAFSAGSHPRGAVNPDALALLRRLGYPTDGLRSKSWDEFGEAASLAFDFIFTVCDDAAAETCPVWPGHPLTAHWGIPDPATVAGSSQDRRAAFETAYQRLHDRIARLVALPMADLDDADLRKRLQEIGRDATVRA